MYSASVDAFTPLLDIGDSARVPVFPYNGISAASNQVLSFPVWYFGLSTHWELGKHDILELNVANIAYSSAYQNATYSFYPVYTRDLDKNWKAALGADVTVGPPTAVFFGSLALTYRL